MSESSTIGELFGARNRGLISLVKLRNSQVPALENLTVSKSESLWQTAWLSPRIGDHSAIGEGSHPVYSGPVARSALFVALTLVPDADTDLGKVLVGAVSGVVVAFEPEESWLLDELDLNRICKS